MISSNLFKVNCASYFGCYQVLGYHVDIIIYNVFSNPSAALSNGSVNNTCGCMYKGTNSLAVSSVFVEAIPAGSTWTKTLPAGKRLNKNWSMFPEVSLSETNLFCFWITLDGINLSFHFVDLASPKHILLCKTENLESTIHNYSFLCELFCGFCLCGSKQSLAKSQTSTHIMCKSMRSTVSQSDCALLQDFMHTLEIPLHYLHSSHLFFRFLVLTLCFC